MPPSGECPRPGLAEQCISSQDRLRVLGASQCSLSDLQHEIKTLRARQGRKYEHSLKKCYEDDRAEILRRQRQLARPQDLQELKRLTGERRLLVPMRSTPHYEVIIEEDVEVTEKDKRTGQITKKIVREVRIGEYEEPENREFYAVLHPHTLALLDGLARAFFNRFRKKLPVVSLTRTREYVGWMKHGRRLRSGKYIPPNPNTAKHVSSHEYGCTFDI